MDKLIEQIYDVLRKLAGLHTQLLEVVRLEREALVQADLKAIQSTADSKQGLIEEVHHAEILRLKLTRELAVVWHKPYRELTLPNIIIVIQSKDSKLAERFQSLYNTLTILIQRLTTQNKDNLALVEKSLEHVSQMKRNVLGEVVPKSNTYTQRGQKANGPNSARLISKEV